MADPHIKKGNVLNLHAARCSCLSRAVETAEICTAGMDISILATAALNEICLGQWEGLTFEEAERISPEQFHNFWNHPSLYTPSTGGETLQQVQTRMVSAIHNIFQENTEANVLVISHWIAIKTALAWFQGLEIDDIAGMPMIRNGAYYIIEMDRGRIIARSPLQYTDNGIADDGHEPMQTLGLRPLNFSRACG